MSDLLIGRDDIDDIDDILRRLDKGRHAPQQGIFFVELMRNYPKVDYAWIETRLRSLGCDNLYLLALPLTAVPAGARLEDLCSRYEPRYLIWHSVNGREERMKTMVTYNISDDAQNLENLKLAGNVVI